jgi:hypothetical protein
MALLRRQGRCAINEPSSFRLVTFAQLMYSVSTAGVAACKPSASGPGSGLRPGT